MMNLARNILRKAGPLVFCLACAGWYFQKNVVRVVPMLEYPSDFQVYHDAAKNVLAGWTPFTTYRYIYPPLFAFLMTPLAPLDYGLARWAFFGLSQVCLIGTAWLMWRALGGDWSAACIVGLVWACGDAAFEDLYIGQIGAQLTFLLALAYTRTAWRQGTALGLGIALKLIPGAAGIAILLGRDRRALSGAFTWMIGTAGICLVVPWLLMALMHGRKSPASTEFLSGTPAFLNWSLPAAVLRSLDPPQLGDDLPINWEAGYDWSKLRLTASHKLASSLAAVVVFGVGILVFLVVTRGKLAPGQLPFAMAALMALGLAACPVAWTHYQVMQYPAVALLLNYAWRLRRWLLAAETFLCGACLYPLPVAMLTIYYYARGGSWSPAAPGTLYFWTSLTPMASLVLFGLLLREVREA